MLSTFARLPDWFIESDKLYFIPLYFEPITGSNVASLHNDALYVTKSGFLEATHR